MAFKMFCTRTGLITRRLAAQALRTPRQPVMQRPRSILSSMNLTQDRQQNFSTNVLNNSIPYSPNNFSSSSKNENRGVSTFATLSPELVGLGLVTSCFSFALKTAYHYSRKLSDFEKNEKAAAEGDTDAMLYLAHCYMTGTGVAKDERKAFEWLKILKSHYNNT